ncbi:MAG: hypothetical protein CMD81_14650 [Gammaproteobacteria bacterium]|nr:hypothetical protein [Gammaproteobacteria bacterium]|tara:strand:- start:3885 stop:4502 length:618 start_codon:yes stop_codon:yes gene_type:complete
MITIIISINFALSLQSVTNWKYECIQGDSLMAAGLFNPAANTAVQVAERNIHHLAVGARDDKFNRNVTNDGTAEGQFLHAVLLSSSQNHNPAKTASHAISNPDLKNAAVHIYLSRAGQDVNVGNAHRYARPMAKAVIDGIRSAKIDQSLKLKALEVVASLSDVDWASEEAIDALEQEGSDIKPAHTPIHRCVDVADDNPDHDHAL